MQAVGDKVDRPAADTAGMQVAADTEVEAEEVVVAVVEPEAAKACRRNRKI